VNDLFNRPLNTFLDAVCSERPALEAVKRKLNALLTAYEDHSGRALRVSDVYADSPDWRGEVLAKRLLDFVDRRPLPSGRRPDRHRQRKAEDKSALRRLLREYFSISGAQRSPDYVVSLAGMNHIPEEWAVLKKVLMRSRPSAKLKEGIANSRDAECVSYSYASQHLLLALRDVSCESGETDLTALLGGRYTDLTRAMRRNTPHSDHRKLSVQFSGMRRRFFKLVGLTVPTKRLGLRLEDFPEPLKSQVGRYREVALLGFGASDRLRQVAKAYEIKSDPYRERSIDSAIKALGACLGHLTAEKGEKISRLGIEDLIKTRIVEIKDDADKMVDVRHLNDRVESFRRKEWAAVRPSKRAEFDSHNFSNLRAAVIVIAAANGFEESIPNFRNGYKVQPDRATRKANKANKKKVFRRRAVDAEIARLKREVFKIIDEGSFKTGRAGKDHEAHRRITNILLLVQMAVLRYLGYRQQCLRACRVDEHVFFNPDRSIRFEFPKEVTKNKKHIRITLSPEDHGATHGELLEILWKYYEDVYPYILRRDAGVRGHLFVTVSPLTGKFRRYKHGEDFGMCFVGWGNVHLRYENFPGAQEQNINLHPHFFRGLCVDWLIEDLGWTRDAVATFIGDEPETLKAYINENMVHDATKLLTQSNLAQGAESAARDRRRVEAEFRATKVEYEKALRAKEEQLQELLSQLRTMGELFEREKNEKDEVLRENRQLREATSASNGGGTDNDGTLSTPRPRRKERPTSRRRAGA
jgi:hypothetical protein